METGIRSGARTAAVRDGVEKECFGRIKVGDHDIIRVLAALGPQWVDSRTVRDGQSSG